MPPPGPPANLGDSCPRSETASSAVERVLPLPAVLVAAPEVLCFVFAPPAPTFVGVWVELADAPAFWSVDAFCTVDCDWPPLAEPEVCTCVLVWVVELSLLAEAEELFELVCSATPGCGASSAAAAWTCARPKSSAAMHDSRARPRRDRNMEPPSTFAIRRGRPRVAGFDSPHTGGAIYHRWSEYTRAAGRAESHRS